LRYFFRLKEIAFAFFIVVKAIYVLLNTTKNVSIGLIFVDNILKNIPVIFSNTSHVVPYQRVVSLTFQITALLKLCQGFVSPVFR